MKHVCQAAGFDQNAMSVIGGSQRSSPGPVCVAHLLRLSPTRAVCPGQLPAHRYCQDCHYAIGPLTIADRRKERRSSGTIHRMTVSLRGTHGKEEGRSVRKDVATIRVRTAERACEKGRRQGFPAKAFPCCHTGCRYLICS